ISLRSRTAPCSSTDSSGSTAASSPSLELPCFDRTVTTWRSDTSSTEREPEASAMAVCLKTIENLEFHDSRLVAVRPEGNMLLDLRPAYVHHWEHDGHAWTGVGRLQNVLVRLIAGRVVGKVVEGESNIADGTLRVDDAVLENLIPVPLRRHGRVAVRL